MVRFETVKLCLFDFSSSFLKSLLATHYVASKAANSVDFCVEFKFEFEFSLFYEFEFRVLSKFIKFFRAQEIK